MKNKKGFTLIELLAVIVILSIVAIIAVPRILSVIESSRESAAASSIKLLKDAIRTQIEASKMQSNTIFESDIEGCYTFDFDDKNSNNYENLNLQNKEKFTGSIKYCRGEFTDTNLAFNGSTGNITNEETKKYYFRTAQLGTMEFDSSWTYWVQEDASTNEKELCALFGNTPICVKAINDTELRAQVSCDGYGNCSANEGSYIALKKSQMQSANASCDFSRNGALSCSYNNRSFIIYSENLDFYDYNTSQGCNLYPNGSISWK